MRHVIVMTLTGSVGLMAIFVVGLLNLFYIAQLGEQELAAAAAINGRRTDAIAPFDLRVRELRLEIARLRAEIWDDPAFLASPTDVLQMQIDQLADQLQDVLHGVDNAPAIDRR